MPGGSHSDSRNDLEERVREREQSSGRKVVSTGKKMMNTDLTCDKDIIPKSIVVQMNGDCYEKTNT